MTGFLKRSFLGLTGYLFATISVAACILAKLAIGDPISYSAPFSLVRIAVLLTTLLFGIWPGVYSLVISALAVKYYLLVPTNSFILAPGDLTRLFLYLGDSTFAIAIIAMLRRARREATTRAAEARQTHSLFESFMENSPTIAFMRDDQSRYLFLNRACKELFGSNMAEDWVGKSVYDVHQQEIAEQIYRNDQEVLQSDHPIHFTENIRTSTGEVRHISSYKFPFTGQEGSRFIAGVAVDITDQVKAEEGLLQGEERYRSLVSAVAQIVWMAGPDGGIHEDIPQWRELTGQSEAEIKGVGWTDAVHAADRKRALETWKIALEKGQIFETEYRIRMRNGEYRWFNSRGVPVRNSDGTIREWVGVCINIDARVRAQEQMARANATMAEARDTAVQASRAKSAFLANMSHELRTPLNAILGYAELLEDELHASQDRQVVEDIHRITAAGNQLLALVNDVLDISKIEAGRMTVEIREFSLADVIGEVDAAITPLCELNSNHF